MISPTPQDQLLFILTFTVKKSYFPFTIKGLIDIDLFLLFLLDSPADLHGMWYPPLRRALLCLSKLYRSVDRSTFQGLSQVKWNNQSY
jgi:hypothetical protein